MKYILIIIGLGVLWTGQRSSLVVSNPCRSVPYLTCSKMAKYLAGVEGVSMYDARIKCRLIAKNPKQVKTSCYPVKSVLKIFSSCYSCAPCRAIAFGDGRSWLNQKHHLLVPISVNSWFFQNFFSQNEPNPNESDSTATPYGRGGYNGFSQKIHQKNEPKQSQFKPISKAWSASDMIESCGPVRQCFNDGSIVVVVVKNKSKTSCYPVKNRNTQTKNKKMKNKANL